MTNFVKGTFYVQLQAVRYGSTISKVKAVRSTQTKPYSIEPDSIVIKVNVAVPSEAYELLPTVDISIPLEHVGLPEVESDSYPVATEEAAR